MRNEPKNGGYDLCFRPTGKNRGDPDAHISKYVEVGKSEVNEIARLGVIPADFTEFLNQAIAAMKPIG